MLLFFVFSLVAVLGVRSETDCDVPPECSRTHDFSMKLLGLQRSVEQMGDNLPTNEFFQKNCDFLVEYLRCYKQGCGLRHVVVDLDAIVSVAVEFCNEESTIRKAYVSHYDCFNGVEFTEDSCVSSILRTTEGSLFDYEIRESLETNSVDRMCLFFYFIMTCAVDVITETCGRRAGQAAGNILNRAMEVVLCNPSGKELDAISDFFEVVAENDQQCNTTTIACTEGDKIIDMIHDQKAFPSEEDLQKYCSEFQVVLICPAVKARECDERGRRENIEAYEDLLEVVQDICEETSPFRASYLRSVSCYNSILDKLEACEFDSKQNVNRFMVSENFSPLPFGTKAPFKTICLTRDLIPNCQLYEVAASCGKEAADTLGKLLLSLKKLSLSMHCHEPHMAVWRGEYFAYLTKSQEQC